MLFIFFLVILGLFVVIIIIEPVIDLGQNVSLKAVQILLRDHVLRLRRVEGLGHRHGVELCLPTDEVRRREGLLEVCDLLLEHAVLTQQLRVLFLQSVPLFGDSLEKQRLLLKLLFQGLLIVLLPLSASHRGLSILESLPSFLVLDGVVQERVRAILINNGILQVLLLFVG